MIYSLKLLPEEWHISMLTAEQKRANEVRWASVSIYTETNKKFTSKSTHRLYVLSILDERALVGMS
jgi:hypothetical protein